MCSCRLPRWASAGGGARTKGRTATPASTCSCLCAATHPPSAGRSGAPCAPCEFGWHRGTIVAPERRSACECDPDACCCSKGSCEGMARCGRVGRVPFKSLPDPCFCLGASMPCAAPRSQSMGESGIGLAACGLPEACNGGWFEVHCSWHSSVRYGSVFHRSAGLSSVGRPSPILTQAVAGVCQWRLATVLRRSQQQRWRRQRRRRQ